MANIKIWPIDFLMKKLYNLCRCSIFSTDCVTIYTASVQTKCILGPDVIVHCPIWENLRKNREKYLFIVAQTKCGYTLVLCTFVMFLDTLQTTRAGHCNIMHTGARIWVFSAHFHSSVNNLCIMVRRSASFHTVCGMSQIRHGKTFWEKFTQICDQDNPEK